MDPSNPAVLYACGPNGVYKTVTGAEVQSASTISAVLNGASYLTGPVSPDEIVLITGSGLGPGQLIVATPRNDGLYSSTQLSGTTVQFNGTPAPVIYISAKSGRRASSGLVSVGVPRRSPLRMRGVRRSHSRFRLLRTLPGSSLWMPRGKDKRSRSIRMARSMLRLSPPRRAMSSRFTGPGSPPAKVRCSSQSVVKRDAFLYQDLAGSRGSTSEFPVASLLAAPCRCVVLGDQSGRRR